MGTALAFMMAVKALSLPEMILLRKVIKPKLIGAFVLITGISIIISSTLSYKPQGGIRMEIKILGSGYSNCMKLEERARDAVKQLQKEMKNPTLV
ncbi:putative permease [compost metagenome]